MLHIEWFLHAAISIIAAINVMMLKKTIHGLMPAEWSVCFAIKSRIIGSYLISVSIAIHIIKEL